MTEKREIVLHGANNDRRKKELLHGGANKERKIYVDGKHAETSLYWNTHQKKFVLAESTPKHVCVGGARHAHARIDCPHAWMSHEAR